MKSTHVDSVTTTFRRLRNGSLSRHCSLPVASRSERGSHKTFQSLTRLASSSLAILLLLASTVMAQTILVPAPNLSTGSTPFYVASADFNNDGKADIVTANQTDNTLSVFLGVGDGTFAPGSSFPVGDYIVWIAVGDFNADGRS